MYCMCIVMYCMCICVYSDVQHVLYVYIVMPGIVVPGIVYHAEFQFACYQVKGMSPHKMAIFRKVTKKRNLPREYDVGM